MKCLALFYQSGVRLSPLKGFNSNRSQSGPWWVATQCSPHLLLCTLSADPAAAVVAYSLSIAFHLSGFLATGLRNSLVSSPHLLFGLPASLYVWCLILRRGFQSAAFFAISFFCVLQSSIRSWLLSSFQWLSRCFFSRIKTIFPLHFQLCPFLHRYHS